MIDDTILVQTDDAFWLGDLWSSLRALGQCRLITSSSLKETLDLLPTANARLVVVQWAEGPLPVEALDALLWANSVTRTPAQVVVIGPEYRADAAITLFQMGVDEYLGMSEHEACLTQAIGRLLGRTTAQPRRVATAAAAMPHREPVPAPIPTRLITAAI